MVGEGFQQLKVIHNYHPVVLRSEYEDFLQILADLPNSDSNFSEEGTFQSTGSVLGFKDPLEPTMTSDLNISIETSLKLIFI